MSVHKKIGSFAVLDLETTGLPDYNFNKANITEIAIHGFASDDVLKATTCDIPRINHKLSLIFNPLMMIHPKSEEITGLNNFMLEKESSFDTNAASAIISFLKHLRQPVCLVAHNGNCFDFPLFKQSMEKHKLELPDDLVCIDTLVAIRELDKLAEEAAEVICFSQEDELATPLADLDTISTQGTISTQDENDEKPFDSQKMNETTPKRPPIILSDRRKRVKHDHAEDETSTPLPKIKSRRSLFDSPTQVTKNRSTFGLYKLGSIYNRLFSEAPQVAHQADADVVALQKIMLHYGKSFVEYAEANAKPFADVKKVGAR